VKHDVDVEVDKGCFVDNWEYNKSGWLGYFVENESCGLYKIWINGEK